MMDKLLPPLCLVLALAMLIAGFAVLGYGSPEAGVELHSARAGGDEAFSDALEQDLVSRQLGHNLLIGLLFGGSALMVVTAFLTMRPPAS